MIKNAINYFSYSFLGALIGAVSLPYLTRVLTPGEFAYIGLMQVGLFIFVPLFGFRAESLIGINKVKMNKNEYVNFRNSYMSLSFIIISISFILILFLSYLFLHDYLLLIFLTLIISIFKFLINLHNQELIQDEKPTVYGSLTFLNQVLILFLTVLFLSFFNMSWEGRLIAIIVANIFFSFLRLKFYSSITMEFHLTYQKETIKNIIKFGAPLFIALLASWVSFQSDKLIVKYFFSMEKLGLYTVAYFIGNFLNILNRSVASAFIPKLRKELVEMRGRNFILKFQLIYGLFILLIAIILSIIFYFFDYIILGENYRGVWKIVAFVSFAYAFFGIYNAYGSIFEFFNKTLVKTKLVVLGALVNLSLTFALLPYLGYVAPAVGTMGSFFTIMVASYKLGIKELNLRGVK